MLIFMRRLINFFDSWSTLGTVVTAGHTATGHTAGHSSWHTTWHTSGTTSTLIHLGDNGCANFFQFLLLVFEFILFGCLVSIQPLDRLFALFTDLFNFIFRDLVLDLIILDSLLHLEGIRFQVVLSLDSFLLLFILGLVLFSIIDHLFNIFLGQSSLIVGNGDLVLLTS